jgi:hypothetical protein
VGDLLVNSSLHAYRNLSTADKRSVIIVSILLALLLVLFGFLLGLVIRQRETKLQVRASSERLAIPLTGKCSTSTLVLGTTTFQIQNLSRKADGSLAVPKDTSGIAYAVDGTENPVFVLSPTPQNITVMETMSICSTAIVTRPDCRSISYVLSAPRPGLLDDSVFEHTSDPSITIFFPTVSSGKGFLYQGQLATP